MASYVIASKIRESKDVPLARSRMDLSQVSVPTHAADLGPAAVTPCHGAGAEQTASHRTDERKGIGRRSYAHRYTADTLLPPPGQGIVNHKELKQNTNIFNLPQESKIPILFYVYKLYWYSGCLGFLRFFVSFFPGWFFVCVLSFFTFHNAFHRLSSIQLRLDTFAIIISRITWF